MRPDVVVIVASDVSGIRMTEYLPGPALAARLVLELLRLGERIGDGNEEFLWVEDEARRVLGNLSQDSRPGAAIRSLGALIRDHPSPVSRQLLVWADRALTEPQTPNSLEQALDGFRSSVATDFGRALEALQRVQGWEPFCRHIVLTGGVGQNIFVRSDHSFISRISAFLDRDTALVRSRLVGGGERAAWFFHSGVFH